MSRRPAITLQVARYRFHWQVTAPLHLPPYASSTLRGAFGHALRQQACLTGASDCHGCAMLANCPYPDIFEPQVRSRPGQPPALSPYAIEPPYAGAARQPVKNHRYMPGEQYHFDMVLMAPGAIRQLPLVIAAWKTAFAHGVGTHRGKAALINVEQCLADETVRTLYSARKPWLQKHDAGLGPPHFSAAADVKLHLQTPLRIQKRGQLINVKDITPGLFLRNLIRRVSFHACAQQPDAYTLDEIRHLNDLADQVRSGESQLSWYDWQRYSTRQKQKMTLGGLVGNWQLHQVPAELLPFLYLGQWLHVGKESAFGLGKYVVSWSRQ